MLDEKFLAAIENFHSPVIDLLGVIIVVLAIVIVGLFWLGITINKRQSNRCELEVKTKNDIILIKDGLIEKKNEQIISMAKELSATSQNTVNAVYALKEEQKELIRKIDDQKSSNNDN